MRFEILEDRKDFTALSIELGDKRIFLTLKDNSVSYGCFDEEVENFGSTKQYEMHDVILLENELLSVLTELFKNDRVKANCKKCIFEESCEYSNNDKLIKEIKAVLTKN